MTLNLVRKDPPASGSGRPEQYSEIVKALQADAGNWYVVKDAPADKVGRLSSPQKRLKDLGCEAVTRTSGDGRDRVAELYARWPAASAATGKAKAS